MTFSKIQNYAEGAQRMGHVYPQNTMLRSFAVVSRIGLVIEHQSSEKAVIYSGKKTALYYTITNVHSRKRLKTPNPSSTVQSFKGRMVCSDFC